MGHFVGRGKERSRALDAVGRRPGSPGAVVLTGEPGIGKSRLAREVAADNSGRGVRVVWGRCWEAGGAPSFWPWSEALGALGVDLAALAEATSGGNPQHQRLALFARVVAALNNTTDADGPVLVVLDDVHAADVASLQLLLFAARAPGRRWSFLATAREVELQARPDASEVAARVLRETQHIALDPLTRDDVLAWARAHDGDDTRAERIYELSEGNPLFVEELLQLQGERALGPSRLSGLSLVLDEHLGHLDERTRAVLEQAAVLGREVDVRAATALTGCAFDDVEGALRVATNAGVLHDLGGGAYVFRHVLLRDRLYDGLALSRRLALHQRAAAELARAGGEPALVAHHLLAGHDGADGDALVDGVLAAARDAMERLAFEQADELCERGLLVLGPALAPNRACELMLTRAEAASSSGLGSRAREFAARAAELARAGEGADALARAALQYAEELVSAMVDPLMCELLEEALAQLPPGDSVLRARLQARSASAHTPSQETAEQLRQIARAEAAIAMAERIGDEDTLFYALRFGCSTQGYAVGGDERIELLTRTITLGRRKKHRFALPTLLSFHICQLLERGQLAEADAALAESAALLDEIPGSGLRWRLEISRASRAGFLGDLDAALAHGEEAWRLAEESRSIPGRISWLLHRIGLAHACGEPGSIAPDADRLLALGKASPMLAAHFTWVLAALGRREEAATSLRSLGTPKGFPWLIVCGDAATMIGDPGLAASAYELLLPEGPRNRFFWGPAGTMAIGPTERILGDLASLCGRDADARAHYAAALTICEVAQTPPFLALTRAGLARLEADTPAPPRRKRAARTQEISLTREGDVWLVSSAGRPVVRLKHGKGLVFLDELLRAPGRDLHVLALVGAGEGASDAGFVLDQEAKQAYHDRLRALDHEREEAEQLGDAHRVLRAEEETEALARQLAAAVGAHGDRRAVSNVQRARINVQRRLKDTIERIGREDPELGRYLEATIKTGVYCAFVPL